MTSLINASTSAGVVITPDTSGVLALQTAGTTAVTVDASQRVGIGTASPATKVDNTGSFRSTGVTDPVSGAGLELCYRGTVADVLSYNRDTSQFTELQVRGSPIAFLNAGGERARIPSTGGIQSVNSISVGNATPSTSGAGITFPATQSASSDANTLDDYEEGTWTPSVGGTATYTAQGGQYVKIGRQVTVFFDLTINIIGTGSASTINSLPFVCSATATGQGGIPTFYSNLSTSAVYIAIRVDNGANQIVFAGSTAATATLSASFSCLGSTSRMIGTMTYTAA